MTIYGGKSKGIWWEKINEFKNKESSVEHKQ